MLIKDLLDTERGISEVADLPSTEVPLPTQTWLAEPAMLLDGLSWIMLGDPISPTTLVVSHHSCWALLQGLPHFLGAVPTARGSSCSNAQGRVLLRSFLFLALGDKCFRLCLVNQCPPPGKIPALDNDKRSLKVTEVLVNSV
jgi:hypothetical protein